MTFATDPITGLPKIAKDAAASLVYAIDVAAALADGDTVTGVTGTASGVSAGTPTYAGSVLSVRISAGANGVLGSYEFTWTTAGGDTDRRTILFDVRAR